MERFFQFSIWGLVTSGFLAVAGSGRLDTPTLVATAAGLALRGLLILGAFELRIPDRLATAITLLYSAFFLVDCLFVSRSILPATVHLVFFTAVMRILTAKRHRDEIAIAAIAFLELLAAAILSIDLNFFVCLAVYLAFAVAALTSGEIRRSMHRSDTTARTGLRRFHGRLAVLSVSITLGILALTAGLFFILPRTADAAFSRLAWRGLMPGYSNQVILGQVGEIQVSSRPVMHVRIFSREAVPSLKWRGGVLTDFDGKRWSDGSPRRQLVPIDDGHADLGGGGLPGRRLNYDVQLEPMDGDALFFAGTPEKLDLRARAVFRTEAGAYRLGRAQGRGVRYAAYSRLEEPPEGTPVYPVPVLPLAERERNLEHAAFDRRIVELAHSITSGVGTDLARARTIEEYLRTHYTYALVTPSREPADPLAYFLFTSKKGYCEYFASSMAAMLRAVGIPARLATGFQAGLYNPLTELWLVRASDAHSWVEAWIPGHGWSTFDPTPPDTGAGLGMWSQAGLFLDAAQTFWQEWVLNYDLGHQGTLADRMEQGARRAGIRWYDSLEALQGGWRRYQPSFSPRVALEILIAALIAAGLWLVAPPLARRLRIRRRVEKARRGQASAGDATLLYERMQDIVKRRGFQRPGWFTPAEFAATFPEGARAEAVREFTAVYNEMRFGGRAEAAPRLSALLDRIERPEE